VNQGKGMGLKRGLLPLEFHTATVKVPPYCGVLAAAVDAAVVVAFVVVTFVVVVVVEFVVVAVVITFVVAVVEFLEQEGNTKAATSIKPSPRYKIFFFNSSSPSLNYYRKYNQLFTMIFTFFPPLGYEIWFYPLQSFTNNKFILLLDQSPEIMLDPLFTLTSFFSFSP
jgi:hypothetical protein